MKLVQQINRFWSATQFEGTTLTDYAQRYLAEDVRNGITILAAVSLLLLSSAALLYYLLGFGTAYVYTFSLLAMLALHITVSTRLVRQTEMLYLLGITLLIVAGTAFVLLAHKTGAFSAGLMSSTVLLFMVIPLVPWGVREATAVVCLIYLMFTLSTLGASNFFDTEVLWLLQFLMIGSAMITLTVVARNVSIRKDDIQARFELENAHREMEELSYKDPLTATWNRRYLEQEYENLVAHYRRLGVTYHLAVIDLNRFKQINDNHGHDCGDIALMELAQVFRQQHDEFSYLIRVGGDEFVFMFAEAEPVEFIYRQIEALHTLHNSTEHCSDFQIELSCGVVSVDAQQPATLHELFRQADTVLYEAKSISKERDAKSYVVSRAFSVPDGV